MTKIHGNLEFDLYGCNVQPRDVEKIVKEHLRHLHETLSQHCTGSVNGSQFTAKKVHHAETVTSHR